ncbi:hypothetical protein PCASD_18681 [Puccinia coronata f. sp. avenae]|uniref:Uncharacterized protein n=1 Tax=Puccinia coronata f. sp. avenae TaxID=200324 RepID=A0A2N5SWU7_9BASI|nr:hypothetical protein PCASD_18681 [Puccinia coronata f. sp. avenae]
MVLFILLDFGSRISPREELHTDHSSLPAPRLRGVSEAPSLVCSKTPRLEGWGTVITGADWDISTSQV